VASWASGGCSLTSSTSREARSRPDERNAAEAAAYQVELLYSDFMVSEGWIIV
jgi:hypothetical protein